MKKLLALFSVLALTSCAPSMPTVDWDGLGIRDPQGLKSEIDTYRDEGNCEQLEMTGGLFFGFESAQPILDYIEWSMSSEGCEIDWEGYFSDL